jgi:hypothetical protein
MGGGEHARLRLRQRGSVADAVHFRAAEALATVRSGDAIDVVFHLQLDEWNGAVKPRLQVRDWRPAA